MLEQILYTACVTPFDRNGDSIDYQSLEKLLKMQENAGNGIVLLGSTGEGLSLSDHERKEIIKFAFGLGLKTQIIAGIPSHNLKAALDWLEFCNQFPVSGYLATTPIYTKPGVNGQIGWFKAILEHTNHSVMAYNIPGRSGIKLHPESVKNLLGYKNFLAIKDSGGTVDSIVDYKIAAPDMAIYCGDDYLMPAMAAEGAAGLISVASNAWPEATRGYVQKSLKMEKLQNKLWWQACRALFTASNPIPVKALLKDIGVINHDTVRLPLSMSDLPARELLLSYHKLINN